MKLLWVLLVIQCASLSHTQGIAAGVCDDWLLVSSILVFTVTIQPSGSVVTTLGGDAIKVSVYTYHITRQCPVAHEQFCSTSQ